MPKTLTVGIVLAAGASSRMGEAKQLLELQGQPMVARMCCLARDAGFDAVLTVTGARQEAVEAALPDFVRAVHNPDWQSGMGSSVSAGLSYALQCFPNLQLAGFILTDQPFLTASLLQKMLRQLQQSTAPGIAARYQRGLGVPALFRPALFPELLALSGQKGAKPLLVKYQSELLGLPFPKGDFDLDYPEDWTRFLDQWRP
ncbi:MAG: nucleotidyltransferase family protein [Phaeodactylibacter sp.]|uniref:nucleotidyltransferase family protein n=1 Tax=Phaeodactylibacter sp. TaxID=1940289 RepID=UPI0032EBA1AF